MNLKMLPQNYEQLLSNLLQSHLPTGNGAVQGPAVTTTLQISEEMLRGAILDLFSFVAR